MHIFHFGVFRLIAMFISAGGVLSHPIPIKTPSKERSVKYTVEKITTTNLYHVELMP